MKLRTSFLMLSLASLLVAALGVISLGRELGRARQPGVSLQLSRGEAVVVSVDPATSHGLVARDRIVMIDGRPLVEIDNVATALARRPGPRHLLVSRAGRPMEVEFTPAPIRPDWHYFFLALVGAATLAISVGALRRAPGERGVEVFGWAGLAISTVLLLTPVRYDGAGRIIFGVEEFARALFPPLLLHFALLAPAGRRQPTRRAGWLYLPAFLLLAIEADLYLLAGRHLPMAPATAVRTFDRLFFLHLGLAAAVAVAIWAVRLRGATSGEEARRLRWLLAGIAGGVLPVALLSAFPHVFGPDWEFVRTLALPSLVLVPLGTAAALVRFRLQEVDRALARGAGAAVTLLGALIVVGSVNLLFERLLPALGEPPRHLASFTAGLGVVMLLAPTRQRITDWFLHVQHRAGERERRALIDFARDLTIADDPARIGEGLLTRIEQSMPLGRANLYWADETGRFLRVRPDPTLPPVVPAESAATLLDSQSPQGPASFLMTCRGRIVGLLLAEGPDGLPPDSEDRALLEALASSAAVALDNARLYRDLAREASRVRQLAEFNERVLESSGSAIAVVDAEGRILTSNSRLADWLGVDRAQVAGRILDEIFPPARLAQSGAGEVSARWARPGEERERAYEVRREPLAGITGVAGTTVVVASDVTEADTLRRELAARERLAAVGLVAASVAHEVNTPLAGISSYAQMLIEDTPADDPRHEILEKIEKQTFRASRLVRDVLDMARGGGIEQVAIDLRDVATGALAAAEKALEAAGVEVATDLPATAVPLAGDAGRLERATVNLLQNAKDAAPGGHVRISVGEDRDGVWLSVSDDGHGMSADERARAFDPLWSTKGRNGTGLGLALAAEVVRAHGGRISIDGAPARGTVVTLRIPRAATDVARRSA